MTAYKGWIDSAPGDDIPEGKRTQVKISGTVSEGARELLLIDERLRKIMATTWSASDGSYEFQINGNASIDSYSVICLPDRFVSNENGAVKSKIAGIAV